MKAPRIPGGAGGLVLERSLGEIVLIDGGRIRLRIIEIRGSRVRLHFQGDAEIKIDREEWVRDET